MQVQILEFDYDTTNVGDIEAQINNYLAHHDVRDVQVVQEDSHLLVFFFSDE